jgi:uncharacterized membrane protein YhaH (DUF805 family)
MIKLVKKKVSIYAFIGIIILLAINVLNIYKGFLIPWLVFPSWFIAPILFVCGFEEVTFKGRYGNIDSLVWLCYFSFSVLIYMLFYLLFYYISLNLIGVYLKNEIREAIISPVFMISAYFIFKFFHLIYKRLQDFNQPGYYLIGILPIISFFIGIKIFKSGYKLLGILVFLNLAVAIIYILIVSGTTGSNYFGVNRKHICNFKKEDKRIRKAESLEDFEKDKLRIELVKKYLEIEIREKEEFQKNEIARLIRKEKLKTEEDSVIMQKRKEFYENKVIAQMKRNYFKHNWC